MIEVNRIDNSYDFTFNYVAIIIVFAPIAFINGFFLSSVVSKNFLDFFIDFVLISGLNFCTMFILYQSIINIMMIRKREDLNIVLADV